MIRLVALDLDGTLLNENSEVSAKNKAAIQRAAAQGVVVTIVTGRMFESAAKIASQLELDVPLITYNGALIKAALSGEVLFEQCLKEEAAREVLDLFRETGWYVQLYRDDRLYVKEITDVTREYESRVKSEATAIGDALYDDPSGILKLLAITEEEELRVVEQTMKERFAGRVFAARSHPKLLEMIDTGVNKGDALEFLAAKLGIAKDEIMAIGDSDNDRAMIERAGFGVAMGNASDAIKQMAQAVTLSNREDGVAAAIERYVLNEK